MGVVEFYIVLSFWVNGALIRQHSGVIPTMEECERLLKIDVEQRIKAHGNGVGHCLPTPERPEEYIPPKRNGVEA